MKRAEEVTVESASKVEQKLIDAPATMSVVTSEQLAAQPAQNMADTLRSVPGLNVIQTSARDINLTARQATSTLATSQLVSVDGRSVYLDFFGLVLWDLVPSPTSGEIKQIEVVRGPASVVWGANAVNGVVNIITKTPRENEGFGIVLGAGLFNRDDGSRESDGDGYQFNGSFSYAKAINDTWSYRLNAGYFNSDPYSRPDRQRPARLPSARDQSRAARASGSALPGGFPIGGATYPADANQPGAFENDGTSQPKFGLRFDQDLTNGGRILYEGGYYGTEGIVHTGIGPFRLESGSYMAYGRVAYSKGALRISAFGNFLDAEAPNLLVSDPNTLGPIILAFKTQTYDLEIGNTNVLGGHHIFTYGGNVRQNNFDISLAQGDDRTELGAYLHWEYFVDKFRFALGGARRQVRQHRGPGVLAAREHHVQAHAHALDPRVLQPRLRLAVVHQQLPEPGHPVPAGDRPVAAQAADRARGRSRSAALLPDGERLRQPGHEGVVDATPSSSRTPARSAARPRSASRSTRATPTTTSTSPTSTRRGRRATRRRRYYSVTNPARGVTVPTNTAPSQAITLSPILMGILAQIPPQFGGPIRIPYQAATYLNLGPIRNRGIEASLDHRFNDAWSAFANYSWQDTPEILDASSGQIPYPVQEVGLPSEHRFNVGLGYSGKTFFGNANVNYASEALWVDVLNASYAGFTDSYTMLNATVGMKFVDGKLTVSLKGINLTNEKIQQHVFGDILKRSVLLELRYFSK